MVPLTSRPGASCSLAALAPRRRLPGCYCQARRWGCLFSRYVLAARRRRNARWYLALSGSSSRRWRAFLPIGLPPAAALRLLGLPLYMRAFTALATCEGRGGVAGRPRGSLRGSSSRTRGSLRGSPPCTNFGPRRPRASTTRPPTALGPEAKPTSASTSAWRAPRSAARARTRAGASRPARTARGGDHPGAARAGDMSRSRANGLKTLGIPSKASRARAFCGQQRQ